ncbi:STAS domain-containing protein [Thiolapillus sp.]
MTGSEQHITLNQHLDLDDLPRLAREIGAAIESGSSLILDGSAVNTVHAAAMQLLLATVRSARQKGLSCQWRQPSNALKEAAILLGMVEELSLDDTDQ